MILNLLNEHCMPAASRAGVCQLQSWIGLLQCFAMVPTIGSS